LDLEETLKSYLSQSHISQGAKSDIDRFVGWCGRERSAESLAAEEVAKYVQFVGGSTSDALRRLEPIKDFLVFAHSNGIMSSNLSSQIRIPKSRRGQNVSASRKPVEEHALTPEGLAQLQAQLESLKNERVRTTDEIRKAAADKDVRENAPLEAARERQGHIDARIRVLERMLRISTVIQIDSDGGKDSRVVPGKRVTLKNVASGVDLTYILVAPAEANPMRGRLSFTSPVGRALLDRKIDERIEVPTPRGIESFVIVSVE